MARQVVSYDDLDAPSNISLQTSIENSSSNPASVTAALENPSVNSLPTTSPPTKKRRHDVDGNTEHEVQTGIDGDLRSNGANASLQSLPPKPPVKKRGRHKKRYGGEVGSGSSRAGYENANNGTTTPSTYHWDDPGVQAHGISYDEVMEGRSTAIRGNITKGGREDEETEEGIMEIEDDNMEEGDDEDESRELTHEEIWDDSALIAAWDAATEEYEVMHGKSKRWKKDRTHRSPLWYNIPPEKPSSKRGKGKDKQYTFGSSSATGGSSHEASAARNEETASSAPLNFETYVPSHDASLAFPGPPPVSEPIHAQLGDIASQYSSMLNATPFASVYGSGDAPTLTSTTTPMPLGAATLSADEAFSRATGAMYWCGYWTAMYHVQRAREQRMVADSSELEDKDQVEEEEEEETEQLITTQR